jgi:tripartite-type tricarboxylate transporter receptor subunit TctC
VRTLQELVDLAKRSREAQLRISRQRISAATSAWSSSSSRPASTSVHVPYKGAGPKMQDVIAGQVQVTVATPPSLIGFVQTNRVRAWRSPRRRAIR